MTDNATTLSIRNCASNLRYHHCQVLGQICDRKLIDDGSEDLYNRQLQQIRLNHIRHLKFGGRQLGTL